MSATISPRLPRGSRTTLLTITAALLAIVTGCAESAVSSADGAGSECGVDLLCTVQHMEPGQPEPSFGAVPPPPGGLPASASVPLGDLRIADQGPCGSCVAFAVRSAMGAAAVGSLGHAIDFSAAHIWNAAGYGSADCPVGSYIHLVVNAAQSETDGIVDSSVWPYDSHHPEASLDHEPPASVLSDRGVAFIGQIATASAGSVDEIRNAIAQGWPVVIGVAVHRNPGWDATGHVDVPRAGDVARGYHAVTVYGYDDTARTFRFMNSWGTGWGDAGTGTFTYDFIGSSLSSGGYAVRNVRPTHAPCPDAGPCQTAGWTCQDAATSVECTADAQGCLLPTEHTCDAGEACDGDDGRCACQPDCAGRLCGDDGCGGQCGPGCGPEYTCTAAGTCAFECPATVFECPAAGAYCAAPNTRADCSSPDVHGCFNVTLSSCDDGNACTHDSCGPGGTCLHEGSPETCNGRDDDCDGLIDEGLTDCGLDYTTRTFSFDTSAGTYSVAVPLPAGGTLIPIVEVRSVTSNGEADGAWDYTYAAAGSTGTFTFTKNYGSANEVVTGRVHVIAAGATTTAAVSSSQVANGASANLSATPPANAFQSLTASYGAVPSYWSGTDDDAEYAGAASATSMSVTSASGNGGSWVRGLFARFSLPAGYSTHYQTFDVANASSSTFDLPRRAGWKNLVLVGVTTYATCGADYFGYQATCIDTTASGTPITRCTVTASNGSACSRVAGRVTQIQWAP